MGNTWHSKSHVVRKQKYIFPDGKRFVMIRGADPQGTREIVIVQNFLEEVKRLAPPR